MTTNTQVIDSTTPQGHELKIKVAELEQALLGKHPRMPALLQEIYLNLRANPNNVTLLAEEDIKIIVNGLEKQTMTELVAVVTKPKSSSSIKKKLETLGDDAI